MKESRDEILKLQKDLYKIIDLYNIDKINSEVIPLPFKNDHLLRAEFSIQLVVRALLKDKKPRILTPENLRKKIISNLHSQFNL